MGVSDGTMMSSNLGLVLKRSVIAKPPFFDDAGAAVTSSSTALTGAGAVDAAGDGAGAEDALSL